MGIGEAIEETVEMVENSFRSEPKQVKRKKSILENKRQMPRKPNE